MDLLEIAITFGSMSSKGHVCALRLADFDPICRFLYFCSQLVVAGIMIDGSKIRKSFNTAVAGVEVQSLFAIERRSNSLAYTGDPFVRVLLGFSLYLLPVKTDHEIKNFPFFDKKMKHTDTQKQPQQQQQICEIYVHHLKV